MERSVPLSVISEHRVGRAKCNKLLSRLRIFVHVRMELLTQLEKEGLASIIHVLKHGHTL